MGEGMKKSGDFQKQRHRKRENLPKSPYNRKHPFPKPNHPHPNPGFFPPCPFSFPPVGISEE